jgi:hypothetical protein
VSVGVVSLQCAAVWQGATENVLGLGDHARPMLLRAGSRTETDYWIRALARNIAYYGRGQLYEACCGRRGGRRALC